MSLHVHRSPRADGLVDALAAVLSVPLADPMATEIVSVPTRGVERWVAQQLSTVLGAGPGRHDGVCANVDFPFPARLVGKALTAEPADGGDIWRPERLVWPLLEVVAGSLAEPWLAPLASYLRPAVTDAPPAGGAAADVPGAPDRRFGAVRHIADLFDRYGVHRPGMIRAWAAGGEVDDLGVALPADCVWQARLWCRLRARLGVASPAERLEDACRLLRADPALVDLPGRLSLFGVTRVPASHAEVLRALAVGRHVHLFALHPSAALWDEIGTLPTTGWPLARRSDPSAVAARNPLLSSWGRDAREMQLVLTANSSVETGDTVDDRFHPVASVAGGAPTLLQRLQADVAANTQPPGVPFDLGPHDPPGGRGDDRALLDADDTSLTVHACHGRDRQVEVLRDAILHLLAADPTLEPRDVIVMCADIETFAPLIHATFGAGTDPGDDDPPPVPTGRTAGPGESRADRQGGADQQVGAGAVGGAGPAAGRPVDLRVRLADRSLRQTNPVLGVVAELLDLAEARLTASQVLDLAGRAPVRARFGFDDDDLTRLERWVDAAGIRWGLDAGHRRPYGLGELEANTWKAGLERLLLGAAMTEDDLALVGGVLPLDDVDSGDLDLAGRLAELIGRLGTVADAFSTAQSVTSWGTTIAEAAAALTATPTGDEWQAAELHRLLDEVVAEATGDAWTSEGRLDLGEIRTLLSDRLRGRPTRANFRTGHLTVCTLVPMRSVPHRVVCLLGLDDGLFPRAGDPDGDDLVARRACVGDRDGRSEDRQLLLDAVMAASDALVVTYSGRDPRTNARLPPAVPLGELLDVVDATVRTADPSVAARMHVTIEHPLQPFDPRNFTTVARGRPAPWSYDPVNLQGAVALLGDRAQAAPVLAGPLPALHPGAVELDDLVRFVQHPVKAFLRQRLGVSLADHDDDIDDAVPIDLDGLGRWGIGDRILAARLDGLPTAVCRAAEEARGALPPGGIGQALLDYVVPIVEELVVVAGRQGVIGGHAAADVTVDLGDGDLLVGTVTGLIGVTARNVTYSTVKARQRLEAWVRLLALRASRPATPWQAVTVGLRRSKVVVVTTGGAGAGPALTAETATAHLRALVDLYRRGMTEPLPLYCETSAAWAAAVAAGGDPAKAARSEWFTESKPRNWDREDRDASHQWALGGVRSFDELLAEAPRPDEAGPGWDGTEATRLGRYARRLWSGLLAHETIGSP